jgi:diacylglycerol kinase family enzyme
MRVAVAMDGQRWFTARSVLVANVGGLIGGLDVAPESDASDGLLHVIVLPLDKPMDWARTAAHLVRRRPRQDDARIHLSGRSAWVVLADLGASAGGRRRRRRGAEKLEAQVRPGSLTVRVPAGPGGT